MANARRAILAGEFATFRATFLAKWVASDPAVGREQRARWQAAQERRRAPR